MVEAAWMLTGDNLVLISLNLHFLKWAVRISMPSWQSYGEASMGKLLVWCKHVCPSPQKRGYEERRQTLFIRVWPI